MGEDKLRPYDGAAGKSAADVNAVLLELERDGAILRTRLEGQTAWCERRLLARVHRYTLDRLRQEIEPVTASEFLHFLSCWQHVDPAFQLEGPLGVAEVLRQLAGFEVPAWAWESQVLAARVKDYRREWLDELTLSGEFAWGRLWGSGGSPIRSTPIGFVPHVDLDTWLSAAEPPSGDGLSGAARDILSVLKSRGAMFPQHLQKAASLPPAYVDLGLSDLLAHGWVTCDSFASLRQLLTPPSRRKHPARSVGRWSCFRADDQACAEGKVVENQIDPHGGSVVTKSPPAGARPSTESTVASPEFEELVARLLLRRTGVVFRRTYTRERIPVSWGKLIRIYRRMELRGEIRGGRFVAGFSGEQYALPEAVQLLRKLRRDGPHDAISVTGVDPLNYQGILTPERRVAPSPRQRVLVG